MKAQISLHSLRSFAAGQFRANSRNLCLLFVFYAFFAVNCPASTNDLTSTLQKGLFEEEANHNFPAAIEAYQGVINRFDEDRKLAATAIFRLGEIYRKQGKTNEANAQYERVVREFSDQSTLATLSQSYLAAAIPSSTGAPTTNVNSESAPTSDEAEEVKKIRAMIRDSPDLINAKDQGGNTPLHRTADLGHLIVARFLVENGADVNAQNADGQTPLNLAAFRGHKALVELLLGHNANVDLANSGGVTALHAASQRGFRSIVEVLLAHGGNVNAKARFGSTPLHLAVANGFKSVADFLLGHGADVNALAFDLRDEQQKKYFGTPLHIAITRADQALADLLLANKANPNSTNSSGDTPLHIAAQLGDPKLAELLLANKTAVDPINGVGDTPLDLAAKSGHTEVASLLLSHGADVDARNPIDRGWKSYTPLLYAVSSGKKEMAALLLKDKADPNTETEKSGSGQWRGCTPLQIATMQADSNIVAALLDFKADPNPRNNWTSPIFAALGLNDRSTLKTIVSMLLDHGADVETPNGEGKTPLMVAVERKDKEIMDLLLAHKANVNAKGSNGLTALHFAVFPLNSNPGPAIPISSSFSQRLSKVRSDINPQPENPRDVVEDIVEALLNAGANVNLQDYYGKTALNYLLTPPTSTVVVGPVRDNVIKLLRDHGAVEDLPRLDAIEVRRPDANFSKVIFTKGTNGWDQFTLLDLIGVQYTLLSASAAGDHREIKPLYRDFAPGTGLDFPDFKRIRIRHPKPDFKGWDERTIDMDSALAAGDCSADAPLQMGDQVEIPEADHVLNAGWEGFSTNIIKTFQKCLVRNISVIVKGQPHSISFGPELRLAGTPDGRLFPGGMRANAEVLQFAPIMIKPALIESRLLLASSDLSRIKLIRGKRELIVDCSEGKPAPSVWLRDGDVIEVPDKP